jgi:tripartite-type tricarboxylate transporter receptor subunit TctC
MGGAPAIPDGLGGQLPLVAVYAVDVVPHVKAGKMRVLAAMSAGRSPILPDVPTIAESGYPGFEASVWYGVIAPAKTPPEVITKLSAVLQKAVSSKEMQGRLSATGGEASFGTSRQFGSLIHSERVRYEKVVREGNIKPD